MNSILGLIQLGKWELGQIQAGGLSTGFTATIYPSVSITAIGGIGRPFTSALGTIQLGIFELGQIPYKSITEQETIGKGSFLGSGYPDVRCIPLQPFGLVTFLAYPDVIVLGNRGPLLVVFKFYPDVTVEGVEFYALDSFTCSANPNVAIHNVISGNLVFGVYPDVIISPLVGQPISCIVSSLLEASGEIKNASF